MAKSEKTTLGRALVKHHNHMIQETKEKGHHYRAQRKKVLESITDVNDVDAVVEQAEEAECLFAVENPGPIVLDLDSDSSISGMTPEQRKQLQKKEESLHASSLRVPRRPPWHAGMSVEELDANEKQAFLIWRKGLAKLEKNEKLVLTPFEKNLDIWRQLWRVVERSELLVTVVDARDPLFYRCPDLEAYVREVDEHKSTMLLINKADLLPYAIRVKWAKYFRDQGILFVYWSAKAASAALEGKELNMSHAVKNDTQEVDADTKILGRDELLARLQSEAEAIATLRRESFSECAGPSHSHSPVKNRGGNPTSGKVTVGFVGYPNVGKSSTINALVGQKCTGVTSTPGKTKHFQTIIISDKLTLCDCPGLVFPSFTSSRHEMVACGVLPIDRMTSHREAVQVVANRVPRRMIEEVYKISLPKPKPYEPQFRPPLASELLRTYCASRGYVAAGGLPDETKAARQMLKDYVDGKLPHFELPPGMSNEEHNEAAIGLSENNESDSSSDVENENSRVNEDTSGVVAEDLLNDLDAFDIASGTSSGKGYAKEKPQTASHKHHRKPVRRKDRSWRTGNDNGDGTPVVRAFQKPVNIGPVKM